jgi:glutamate/tyrosine decarboxylase-like PLP-dependent enzyme
MGFHFYHEPNLKALSHRIKIIFRFAGPSEECHYENCHIFWTFICGLLFGVFLNRCWESAVGTYYRSAEDKKRYQNNSILISKRATNAKEVINNHSKSFEVLEQTLSLVSQQIERHKHRAGNVVNFLSPQDMVSTLFAKDTLGSLSLDGVSLHDQIDSCHQMLLCFRQIQKYSVNTNHPLFFNQLFGALDPVALAAELLAVSINTSAYTFETAPVFTMIEREVFSKLGQLVFGESNFGYDGLMLPGGSISNLTALHTARYYSRNAMNLSNPCDSTVNDTVQEEKKFDEFHNTADGTNSFKMPELVAFVSSEAHYSFAKAASVTGLGTKNLVVVPTLPNGQMDVDALDNLMSEMEQQIVTKIPFFVAATSGSTVRGSFDDIAAIVEVCRKHEQILNNRYSALLEGQSSCCPNSERFKIWIHVDGAWGGSAIFSTRSDIRKLLRGVEHVDSFTFNPHKMLGAPQQTTAFITRHAGLLKRANSIGAKYLFDCRKHGAEYDLGDASYTCGRRTDAVKLWALWKFYGSKGIGSMVESKVDILQKMASRIRTSDRFMLACEPCPFNLNFYYLPMRIRKRLSEAGVDIESSNPKIPDCISNELSKVSVNLKLLLHKSGEMLIPFQPLSSQNADCFRLVLAGNKQFEEEDIQRVLELMDKYGSDL